MRTANQMIELIDNVMNNFLIVNLSDRGELLNIRSRLKNIRINTGGNVYVENSRTMLKSITAISARC
ncbi:MAG: hypothetical protein U9R19_14590 [Bacteroidota bacterium]|nr:hypothetical protein [Bacteroidota bacterium]